MFFLRSASLLPCANGLKRVENRKGKPQRFGTQQTQLYFDFFTNTEGTKTGKPEGAKKVNAEIRQNAAKKFALFWPGDGNIWFPVDTKPATAPKAMAGQGGADAISHKPAHGPVTGGDHENLKWLKAQGYTEAVTDLNNLEELKGYYFDYGNHPTEKFDDTGLKAEVGNSKEAALANRFIEVSADKTRALVTMTMSANSADIMRISSYPKPGDGKVGALYFDFETSTENTKTGKPADAAKAEAKFYKNKDNKVAFWWGDKNVWIPAKADATTQPKATAGKGADKDDYIPGGKKKSKNLEFLATEKFAPATAFNLADLDGKAFFDFKHSEEMFDEAGTKTVAGNTEAKKAANRFLKLSEDKTRVLVTMTIDKTKPDIMRISSHPLSAEKKGSIFFDFFTNTEGKETGKPEGAKKVEAQIYKQDSSDARLALYWAGDDNLWFPTTQNPAKPPVAGAGLGGAKEDGHKPGAGVVTDDGKGASSKKGDDDKDEGGYCC